MARPIPSFLNHVPFSSASLLIASLAALSVFALMIFMCASSRKSKKSNRTPFQQQKNLVSKINSNISCRAISLAKMVSWRKVDAADEEEEISVDGDDDDDDDDEVWRKRIIRGERCRPLEFSGKIDYDSDGNLLCQTNTDFKSVES